MRWWVLLVLGGCYGATPAVGIQCGPGGECPSGQHCNLRVEPPVCETADAQPIDGPPDAPADLCSSDNDCDTTAPICDLTATPYMRCRGCVADIECGQDVCVEYLGVCQNEGNTLFAAPGATGTCTRSSPCSLSSAMSLLANNKRVIAVADGTYTGQLNIPSSIAPNTLTISGTDRDPTGATISPPSSPGLVNNNTTEEIVVEGITFSNVSGVAIDNRGSMTLSRVAAISAGGNGVVSQNAGMLKIFDSRLANNNGRGLDSNQTKLEMRRCIVEGNQNGGLEHAIGSFTIESTWIVNNGTATNGLGGARFQNVSSVTQPQVFAFNTVANNAAQLGTAAGVQCNSSSVTLDSSIFLDTNDSGCPTTYSLYPTTPPNGTGNIMGAPAFVDEAARDYHVMSTSPVRDVANPAGAATTDIDGEPRPQGAGQDIGADELPP